MKTNQNPSDHDLEVLLDRLLQRPVEPPSNFVDRVFASVSTTKLQNEKIPRPSSTAPWYLALGGLAAATAIGFLAFYLLFFKTPVTHYPQQPIASTDSNPQAVTLIAAIPLEELVELDEQLRPLSGLKADSWLMIEALLY